MRQQIENRSVNSVKSTILNTKVSMVDSNRHSPRVRLDRVLKGLTEPDIELLSRKPDIELQSRAPDIGILSLKPDIGLLNNRPDIGLHSREPDIELPGRRANDLQNIKEIQTTDDNSNNKPSPFYSNVKLARLKAQGLQIRSMDIPRKKTVQFGSLFSGPNAANEQERIKVQVGPNRSIQPDQRLTNKKTIHLMPGIRGASDILSLHNKHRPQPGLTDLQNVPNSRSLPQNTHQTISGTHINGNFQFETSLLRFQHASNQGTRQIRVTSPPEIEKKQLHVDAGLANKVSRNNLNPNEYSGQPYAVVVNINTMKNMYNVCASDERFICNPVENNVAVSELHSWCISNCNQRYCPVVKCSCFCISLTANDVKNKIVESNEVMPSKQTNLLGKILENSGTGSSKLPKKVNIIGMKIEKSGIGSSKLPKTVNFIRMNSEYSGTGSPTPSKTINIIGMNAGNSGTGFPTASDIVNIIGMNAENTETAYPTPSKTASMIGKTGSTIIPHEVVLKSRVTCTVTNLFLSIKGMIDWCNNECNISLNNCPMHICDCQFVL
ncbi:unnamed protein product [Mytilus coruscus]|uniref:Uncharacterized protein n=1 Tax=Mytilus coruscus TaxID=42192 RepID=A0A6J8DVQ6_MYTCO|nr:unnamed protein product [Mytilus coruscus]